MALPGEAAYLMCCVGVQPGGGLIQEQHAWVCDEGNADVGALCLRTLHIVTFPHRKSEQDGCASNPENFDWYFAILATCTQPFVLVTHLSTVQGARMSILQVNTLPVSMVMQLAEFVTCAENDVQQVRGC